MNDREYVKYRLKKTWRDTKEIAKAVREALIITSPFLVPAAALVASETVPDAIKCKKMSAPKVHDENSSANRRMFKHAFKDDLKGFKKDLEGLNSQQKKEALLAQNQYGQDVLMISLLSDMKVASYILNDPELSQMVDYSRPDDNNIYAIDIINGRTETSKSHEKAAKQQSIKRLLEQNMQKQMNSAEKDGRGDTYTGFSRDLSSIQTANNSR